MSDPGAEPATARGAAIAAALAAVRARIDRAASAANRRSADVTLVVVTKDVTTADIRVLLDLGVENLGESREQQLRAKRDELGEGGAGRAHWHFVGRLQRNKAAAVARAVHTVHSVDDERLLPQLARGAQDAGRACGCLVQVNLDGAAGRGGVPPASVPRLADAVATTSGLDLRGVMAVAPMGDDPAAGFEALHRVSLELGQSHPQATWVSAGMSGDFESALQHGATHLRIGTAILGSRPAAR